MLDGLLPYVGVVWIRRFIRPMDIIYRSLTRI